MNQGKLRIFILPLIFYVSLYTETSYAQQNNDSLFFQASDHIKKKKYDSAREICHRIVADVPFHYDATMMLARTFAWEKHYDSARYYINTLANKYPGKKEIFELSGDIELWDQNPDKVIEICNEALQQNMPSEIFLYKKAVAYEQKKDYQNAIVILTELQKSNYDSLQTTRLLNHIKEKNFKNKVRAEYQNTSFASTDGGFAPYHLSSIEFQRKSALGSLILRSNLAHRFGRKSIQMEFDAYPKISKKAYLYLNAGISEGNLFPFSRFGAEIYHSLPLKMEFSLGSRALYFSKTPVWLFTGHIGKYFGNYWASVRPFVVEKKNGLKATTIFQIRRYFSTADKFLSLQLVKGTVPFDQVTLAELSRPESYRFGMDFQWPIKNTYLSGFSIAYEYEEYYPDKLRDRFNIGFSLAKIF